MGIFPDAQGQLNPQFVIRSCRISNPSERRLSGHIIHRFFKKLNIMFGIYGILDVKMSNGRGDFPHPLNIMYPNSKRNEVFPIS